MPAEQLTTRERATLLVLLAEGREMTNAQMREVAGFSLDGEPRRRLTDRKLITSRKVGRGFAFELTDDGAAACTAELTASRPPRAGYLGGALYAVLAGLRRGGTPLAELFPFRPDVRDAILRAYERAATSEGGWAALTALRRELAGSPRAEIDAELVRMATAPGVYLEAEPHQSKLTDADRADSVEVGGVPRHMIMIESG